MNDKIIEIIARKWFDVMEVKMKLTKHDKELVMKFAKDCDVFINEDEYIQA